MNFSVNGDEISNSFIELFSKTLLKEFDVYSAGLDKLIKEYNQDNISTLTFFKIINKEMSNSVKLMENIQRITNK